MHSETHHGGSAYVMHFDLLQACKKQAGLGKAPSNKVPLWLSCCVQEELCKVFK